MGITMKKSILIVLMLFTAVSIYSQQNVKVMTWNIHEYSNYNTPPNNLDWDNPALKYVVDYVNPDILVCQEVLYQESVDQLLQYVLENKYLSGNFIQSDNMNSALFYKESVFTFVENRVHPTTAYTRPFNEFVLIHKGTNDTLRIFSLHLKANSFSGNNDDNIQKRNNEIAILRNRTSQLRADADFLILGDLNSLNGSEPGIVKLFDQTTTGYVYDPLNALGQWENNPSFAYTHTMYAQNLTVRFDMILISQAVKDPNGVEYVNSSYKIVGNDGNHFNTAINVGSNSFGKTLADSLISASDHLPVYVTLKFNNPTSVEYKTALPENFELFQNYPNPFNPSTTISYELQAASYVTLKVYDLLGREIAILVDEHKQAGNYKYQLSTNNYQLSSGVYFYTLKIRDSSPDLSGSEYQETKKMLLIK